VQAHSVPPSHVPQVPVQAPVLVLQVAGRDSVLEFWIKPVRLHARLVLHPQPVHAADVLPCVTVCDAIQLVVEQLVVHCALALPTRVPPEQVIVQADTAVDPAGLV